MELVCLHLKGPARSGQTGTEQPVDEQAHFETWLISIF
jgi:hypothetical protein